MNFLDGVFCPQCESELSYPDRCGNGDRPGCGWFKSAGVVHVEVTVATEVKERITALAKQQAKWEAELSGRGQGEYEPRFVERTRLEALRAVREMNFKRIP